jgi:hypothetical protein
MDGNGEIISDDKASYLWMDDGGIFHARENVQIARNEFRLNITPTLNKFNWKHLLDTARPVFNVNFYQAIMMLAGSMACFHYPYAIKIAGMFCVLYIIVK